MYKLYIKIFSMTRIIKVGCPMSMTILSSYKNVSIVECKITILLKWFL